MMSRLRNSWELVKASAKVLQADKELIIFPILSSIGVILVSLAFALPMFFSGILDSLVSGHLGDIRVAGLVITFLFYFVQYFVIISSNAALVGAANIRLQGGDPTVSDGIRIATQHLGSILGYTLIASTVGLILRTISNRSQTAGRVAVGLLGLAWNLATFLVVPVLVIEGLGPIAAVKRSASLLKQTWGEQIAGNLSISFIFGLISMGLMLVVIVPAGFLAYQLSQPLILVPMVGLLIVLLVIVGLISSTLQGIYAAAIYRFATEGDPGHFFSPDLVQNAFRTKSGGVNLLGGKALGL
jgi:Family of unknown function (DUF6159)